MAMCIYAHLQCVYLSLSLCVCVCMRVHAHVCVYTTGRSCVWPVRGPVILHVAIAA